MSENVSILIALGVQLALGLLVFQSNWRRLSNQCFLLLSCAATIWLSSLYAAATARSEAIAEFAIREASCAAVLILTFLNLLRLSLRRNNETWKQLLYR